jgi:hypothetical protein
VLGQEEVLFLEAADVDPPLRDPVGQWLQARVKIEEPKSTVKVSVAWRVRPLP